MAGGAPCVRHGRDHTDLTTTTPVDTRVGRGWKRRFDDAIPLPRRRQPVTLEDAGTYITKLPKAEHEAAEWLAAMEALILVATFGRPDDVRANWHHEGAEPRPCSRVCPSRKDHHWGRWKLGSGSV
jgi:hypothetical protein